MKSARSAAADDRSAARRAALGWLARREHSLEELRAKLERKGYTRGVATETVAGLAREGLASDARFAESLAESRRARGYGPARIRRELAARGLAPDLIEQLIDFSSSDWLAELRRVRRKKFGAREPRDRAEWARQARFLQGRGFTVEQIRRVLNDGPDETMT